MRLWLNEDERRPGPEPARADARKAVAAGTAGWLVALAAFWWFREPLDDAGYGWLVPMSIIGASLGIAGLVVVQLRRMRAGREEPTGQSRAA
ncbi:DUF2530 domain-containing protein [Agromyces sp. G08B096]|uniref:DUF2530 domain-containing protein n=1 Tax=Agromyces sp. G08B096 TaxID=3156399 RepID=A0AAU7WAI1_9MICO